MKSFTYKDYHITFERKDGFIWAKGSKITPDVVDKQEAHGDTWEDAWSKLKPKIDFSVEVQKRKDEENQN